MGSRPAIPCRFFCGARSSALLSVVTDLPDRDAGQLVDHFGDELGMILLYFHAIAGELISDARPSVKLTPREIDCLSWAAKGKTRWETAHILKVSDSTVRFHLENARNKLAAGNVTHAVALGVRDGIIKP